MSHQIVITFDLDENRVQENAEKEAGRQIAKHVIDAAFGNGFDYKTRVNAYVRQAVKEILEPEKDAIIEEAIKEVIGQISRTKAVRERLGEELKA